MERKLVNGVPAAGQEMMACGLCCVAWMKHSEHVWRVRVRVRARARVAPATGQKMRVMRHASMIAMLCGRDIPMHIPTGCAVVIHTSLTSH